VVRLPTSVGRSAAKAVAAISAEASIEASADNSIASGRGKCMIED